jgi:L-arabinose isomerase
LFGRPYPGMMDLNVDETQLFKKFGIHTYHLQWEEVVTEAEYATRDEIRKHSEDIVRTFTIPDSLTGGDVDSISEILCGFARIVDKYNLCAIPNHYEGAPAGREVDLLAALNPALSMLMAKGIACPVEADMKAAIAMIILKTLGGSATLAELYAMDFNDDVCIIGHSGAGDPAITGTVSRLDVTDVFHGKSGRGYVTQFYPKHGPITLLSLTQDAAGDYKMIVAEGECVEGPILNLGDTNGRIRFPCGLRSFVNTWSASGPTHHGVIGLGHHIEALRRVSLMLDIPLEVVCNQ